MAQGESTFVLEFVAVLIVQKLFSVKEGQAVVDEFRDASKEAFVNALLDRGVIRPAQLLKALSTHYQVPSFDAVGHFFDTALLHKFPKDVLLRNAIIPLERDGNMLVMLVSEPDDAELLAIIGQHVSYDIRFYVGIRRAITDAVKEFYDEALTEVQHDEDLREQRRLEREQEGVEKINKK